jgi:hypothetical protein
MILRTENRRIRRITCHSATFSITNLTWTDVGANRSISGVNSAANRLNYGTVSPSYTPKLQRRNSFHTIVDTIAVV